MESQKVVLGQKKELCDLKQINMESLSALANMVTERES